MRSIAALVLLSTALFLPAPASAEEAAWLAGEMARVAAHRTDLPLLRTSSQPLMGYLARPDEPARHPAVVELHGCGGFGPMDVVVADVLKSFGYVALALDSLGDANVCEQNSGDGEFAEAFDAYATLDWLAEQSYVDFNRVTLLGFSMGGGAALSAVEPRLIEDKKSRHFRAAIAYYPWCKDRTGLTTVPTLIVVGDRDDWTQASWCQEMMARRDGHGSPVELTVYPGATHAFNFFPGAPRVYLGHHIEYDPKATADAWKQVRSFLQELDGPGPADHTGVLRK